MVGKLIVFSGRSNLKLSQAICDNLQVELGRLEVIKFSDGELSVDIDENVRGRDVFVIQSTSTPGNDHLMELLIIVDALKRSSAGRITAVIPYFGYARQDRKLKPRVPITAKLVSDLIVTSGIDRLLTMDLHSGQIMGFFNIPVDNLNPMPVFVPHLLKCYKNTSLTVVSPDVGGVERARLYSSKIEGSEIAIIYKRRSGPNQISGMRIIGDVKGKECVIIDDIIDTAGTLVKASEALLEAGAVKIYACCTHPVLSGAANEKIQNSSLEEVFVSDTISLPAISSARASASLAGTPQVTSNPHNLKTLSTKIKSISVAPLFAEAIKRIHSNDSVSSLFY
jgi:ribose-phosphate pyrophosphokinase